MFLFLSCFLSQSSSWPSTPQKKMWNLSESMQGRREGKGMLCFSPFLCSNQKKIIKKKKGEKKKHFFNQPKAATHPEKQKHQNKPWQAEFKICLWMNTQHAKLWGKSGWNSAEFKSGAAKLIREGLLLLLLSAWWGGKGESKGSWKCQGIPLDQDKAGIIGFSIGEKKSRLPHGAERRESRAEPKKQPQNSQLSPAEPPKTFPKIFNSKVNQGECPSGNHSCWAGNCWGLIQILGVISTPQCHSPGSVGAWFLRKYLASGAGSCSKRTKVQRPKKGEGCSYPLVQFPLFPLIPSGYGSQTTRKGHLN